MQFIKLVIGLFILVGASTVQAYKLSDYTEYKEAKKLCTNRHSAESCARAVYLFGELFYDLDSPITKISPGRKKQYQAYLKRNVFYKIGCSLGDKIQCLKHDMNIFKIKIISEYSSLRSGISELKFSRGDEVRSKEEQLSRKYINGYAEGQVRDYLVLNGWYDKASTVTIDEIKRQKNNGTLWGQKHTKKNMSSSKQKMPSSITIDEKQLFLDLKAYFIKFPKDYKFFTSLPKSQQAKVFQSLKGKTQQQRFTQLSKVLKPSDRTAVRSSLSHMHAGHGHSHKLPSQGKAHRHGNGAIGR